MRAAQPEGQRGSLKWIQRAVEQRWPGLEQPFLSRSGAREIMWLSPLRDDDFAEYRDSAFLERLDLAALAPALAELWPRRGPQWDALGRTTRGDVLLVEAKAHIGEFCSPGTAASNGARARIIASLTLVAEALGSPRGCSWPDTFYQYANRIAHLWFLRREGINAYLLLVGFLGDADMKGPNVPETWSAAYRVADHALGLPARHALTPFIIHAHPMVLE